MFSMYMKGYYKRDNYKVKNKSKQQAISRDKRKSKALLTWSDDEDSTIHDESSDEMVNLTLVGLDNGDIVQRMIEECFIYQK